MQAGKQLYGDQLEWNKDWDDNKNTGDILFLTYEDMKADLATEMKKVAEFIGIYLSDSLMQRIIDDVNIKKMKADSTVRDPGAKPGGAFVRAGQSGEWKKYFTVEQNEWFDQKYKEGYLKLGVPVDYE